MTVPIVLYPGVSGWEALGALAALRAAGLDAELVAVDALVPTQEGARVVPARLGYATLEAADALVLPGGDARRALGDADLARALRARRGKWTLASGDAIRLLGPLAEARRVATPPGADAPPGATASHARLVADGRLLTSAGGDALADLVLHYVAHVRGDEVARRAAESLGRAYQAFAMGATDA